MSLVWTLTGGSYEVSSKEHILQIMSLGNLYTDSGDSPTSYMTNSYIQTNDLDLDSETVTPIGTNTIPFTGEYDGSNYVISNWSYSGSLAYAGLFGYLTGTIKNINLGGIWSINSTSTTAIGTLLAYSDGGSIFNCSSSFETGTSLSSTGTMGCMIGICTNSTQCHGITTGGTISSCVSTSHMGGVIGRIIVSSTISFVRNIATFETTLSGLNAGGVTYQILDSNCSYVMNAMTGDIMASNQVAGIVVTLGNGNGNTTDVLVNSMRGDITGSSGNRNGGIAATLTGRFSTGTFNRLVNYMTGDLVAGTRGGLFGTSQIFGESGGVNVTNSIVATNGSLTNVNYGSDLNPGDTSYNVLRDNSFGMTFSGSSGSSTSASLSGFATHSEFPDLPYIPFIGTDSDGNTYNWEFVFPNVNGKTTYSSYTDLAISASNISVPIGVIFDLDSANTTQYATFIDTVSNEAFTDETLVVLDSSATTIYDYTGVEQLFPSLISATIYTHLVDLNWNAVVGAFSYNIEYTENGGSTVTAASGLEDLNLTIYDLNAGSTYIFNVYSDLDLVTPVRTITITSPTVSDESVSSLLVRLSNDLTLVGDNVLSEINDNILSVLSTGDIVGTDIGFATFVESSDSVSISGANNILTPFDQDFGSSQTFDITLPDLSVHTISYDETVNTVSYNSVTYVIGDHFVIGDFKISVQEFIS